MNKKKDKEACVSCGSKFLPVDLRIHPVLSLPQCSFCHTSFLQTGDISTYRGGTDRDGSDNFCRCCGDGGDLILCHEKLCRSGFCNECVQRILGQKRFIDISKHGEQWYCFVCDYIQISKLKLDRPNKLVKTDLNKLPPHPNGTKSVLKTIQTIDLTETSELVANSKQVVVPEPPEIADPVATLEPSRTSEQATSHESVLVPDSVLTPEPTSVFDTSPASEPDLVLEPAATPELVEASETASASEPVTIIESEATPEPATAYEPASPSKPTADSEPAVTSNADTVFEPDASIEIFTCEPDLVLEPAATPELVEASETPAASAPITVTESEAIPELVEASEPVTVTESEAISESVEAPELAETPSPSAAPKTSAFPEKAATPETVPTSKKAATHEQVPVPESVSTPQQMLISETGSATKRAPTSEQITELLTTHPEPVSTHDTDRIQNKNKQGVKRKLPTGFNIFSTSAMCTKPRDKTKKWKGFADQPATSEGDELPPVEASSIEDPASVAEKKGLASHSTPMGQTEKTRTVSLGDAFPLEGHRQSPSGQITTTTDRTNTVSKDHVDMDAIEKELDMSDTESDYQEAIDHIEHVKSALRPSSSDQVKSIISNPIATASTHSSTTNTNITDVEMRDIVSSLENHTDKSQTQQEDTSESKLLNWALKDAEMVTERAQLFIQSLQRTVGNRDMARFSANPTNLFAWVDNLKTMLAMSGSIIRDCESMYKFRPHLKSEK